MILFFNYGGPSWVGIKIVIPLYKVQSKPVKNEISVFQRAYSKVHKLLENLNENQYFLGLLMTYSRLFRAKAKHDLVFNTFLEDCM